MKHYNFNALSSPVCQESGRLSGSVFVLVGLALIAMAPVANASPSEKSVETPVAIQDPTSRMMRSNELMRKPDYSSEARPIFPPRMSLESRIETMKLWEEDKRFLGSPYELKVWPNVVKIEYGRLAYVTVQYDQGGVIRICADSDGHVLLPTSWELYTGKKKASHLSHRIERFTSFTRRDIEVRSHEIEDAFNPKGRVTGVNLRTYRGAKVPLPDTVKRLKDDTELVLMKGGALGVLGGADDEPWC